MIDPKHLWPHPQSVSFGAPLTKPERFRLSCDDPELIPSRNLLEDLSRICDIRFETPFARPRAEGRSLEGSSDESSITIRIEKDPKLVSGSAYSFDLRERGGELKANLRSGAAYALITLAQIVTLSKETSRPGTERGKAGLSIPSFEIEDWPQYRKRCFMVDLGRSVYSVAFLERIVRILALLKMNQLHLHLYDDELCGIRFPDLPFGTENPFAIGFDDLERLIAYAADYEVEIVPELEGWGHVASLTYHRPELAGGRGMYGGASFRIGSDSFDLMERLIDAVASILPDRGIIHLGLDEANWFAADDLPSGFTPSDMVGRYWELVSVAAERHHKYFDLRLWADHAGRPVPEAIWEHLIIEPWQYWILHRDSIDRAIGRYGGAGKMRFMMGTGQSNAQYRGAYHATRYWARQGKGCPNVEGANITFWGANNLDANFMSLFAGSWYLWNPDAETEFSRIEDYEMFDRHVAPIMRGWQTRFPDARPDRILADRGPYVDLGRYVWGERHREAVAPTVETSSGEVGVE